MTKLNILSLALGILPVITLAQVVSWCKDDECGDCPSAVTTGPSRHPECVIYDTEVVFGGQGFKEGEIPNIKYEPFANMLSVPCDGEPGGILVRSPSSFDIPGCGNAILARPADQGCQGQPVQLQDTFLVQYCCGTQECASLGIPLGGSAAAAAARRTAAIGGHTRRDDFFDVAAGGGGGRGLYLTFKNGTVIPPKAVGSPSTSSVINRRQDCDGWQEGSYTPNGDIYFKTFDTIIISATVGPFPENTLIEESYDQTLEVSTTFSLSVGDPLGIISASVGVTFSKSETKGLAYTFTVPAGVTGRIGFTPVYVCTKGTLKNCDGNPSDETETCAPWKSDGGIVQGDYTLVA